MQGDGMDRDDNLAMGSGADAEVDAATDAAEAVRAFQALRAEVGSLHRTVSGLPEAIEGVRAPDYGPTLGQLVQGLGGLDARLAAIAGHTVLAMTPQEHARAAGEAAAGILRTAATALRTQTEALAAERAALAGLVGHAATAERQGRVRLGFGVAGLALGLVLFPLLGAVLPGGGYLAALATGTSDRWLAGSILLRAANPESAAALTTASRLSLANPEALQACTEAARRSGTAQRCLVSVPVPGR